MTRRRESKAAAEPPHCTNCGTTVDEGDRFCRKCGAALKGTPKPNGGLRGLVGLRAFGLAALALVVVFALLVYGSRDRRSAPGSQRIDFSDVGAGGPAVAEAPQPVSPRLAADHLFNEAMTAYEMGDSAGTRQFVPMAISAYRGLAALDADARYHLALLGLAAGRPRDALAQADTMLAEAEDHLLGLSAAATAYAQMGQDARAIEYYRRFLSAYTPEVAASRSEYMDHARALPARRDEARRYLEAHGIAVPNR
jgi:tetratricopeptide (TPR) repeat protein